MWDAFKLRSRRMCVCLDMNTAEKFVIWKLRIPLFKKSMSRMSR